MGSNSSGASVSRGQTKLDFVGHLAKVLPIKIPKVNHLKTIDLSGNQLTELPWELESLVNLNLARNKLIEFPKKMAMALASYKNLEYLDLSDNDLRHFPSILAKLERLNRLNVSKNQLTSLPFLPGHITNINLSQNRFEECPEFAPQIQSLTLAFNLLEEFHGQFEELRELSLEMNRIRFISDESRFLNLEVLQLSRNLLESLPDLRNVALNLKVLKASDNCLNVMPYLPPGIEVVELNGNMIREIPEWVKDLKFLKKLNVAENHITRISALPQQLRELNVFRNEITDIAECDTAMEFLWITNNRLRDIPPLPGNHIRELYLTRNQITSLSVHYLWDGLVRIDATGNHIKELPPELFSLPNLAYLNVCNNDLTTLPNELRSAKLVCLNISENPITVIPDVLPQTLGAFYCSYCGISRLPNCRLEALETLVSCGNNITDIIWLSSVLKKVMLSRNKITRVPNGFPSSILLLDLSCNCITEIQDSLCLPALLELDLSYNEISHLPDLSMCMRLHSLKLSGNPLSGVFDVSTFPFLDCLDLSFTDMVCVHVDEDNIREILTSNPNLFSSYKFKLMTDCSSVGYAEFRGQRDEMEDAVVVRPGLFNGCDLYCVLDGHGGSRTSSVSAFMLVQLFREQCVEFSEAIVVQVIDTLSNSLRRLNLEDGSTLAMALLSGNESIIAHLGDSRVLIIKRDGTVRFSTQDHRPNTREEVERILSVRGMISENRTGGAVAVTRSLGDFSINEIGRDPTITRVQLQDDDRWLVLGCDGLFDRVPNKDIGEIASRNSDAKSLAYDLRNTAYHRLSTDNISTVVVDLLARSS